MMLLHCIARTNCRLETICFLFASFFTFNAYSQQTTIAEDWLSEITKKHDIVYDSYSQYGNWFIIGEKKREGELDTYKTAIVISQDPKGYWIFKSDRVIYNPSSTILDIYDCMLEKFAADSSSIKPMLSKTHIDFSINFTQKTSSMLPAKQKEIK